MALDPNIPLSYRPPQIESLGESAAKTQTLRQMMEEEAIKSAYVVGPDGAVDRQATMANLFKRNPQFAYKQGREWRIDDTQDQTADLRQQELDARVAAQKAKTEQEKSKANVKALGLFKKAAGDAMGMFQLSGDINAARQAYAKSLESTMRLLNMNEQERGRFIETLGGPDQFTPEGAEAMISGEHDNALLPMVDHFVNTRGQLMTDEGEIVSPAYEKSEDGTFVPTGPVAEEGDKWYTRPPKTPEDEKKWGAFITLGRENKWFKGNEPYLNTPVGVIKNPYYWKAKEDDYQLKAKYKVGTGTELTVNTGALTPGKVAGNKVDEGILETTARLQRLSAIEASYKPAYTQLGTRLGNVWTKIKEKAGADVSPQDQKELREFSQWKRQSLENLNQYVKEITGAAMTDAEAGRIRAALPDPGQNWWDGDSATEFKSKMDDVVRQLKMAEARYVYIKRNGMSIEGVSLERMPQIMNQRGAAMERDIRAKNPKMDKKAIQNTVKRALAQEFGLAAD
jgi:hypothetical protein